MTFQDFNLENRCLRALARQNISNPTPVQEQAIPLALEGRDLTAIAQTGTGKTLAFGLPAITRLAQSGPRRRCRMLVVTPTRELVVQVHAVLGMLAKPIGLRTACVYGGVGMEPQTKALRQGSEVVVATPGRLLDHIARRNTNFRDLSILVLDEADRMLDMGFLPDIKRILAQLPQGRQTMLFSATFPSEIAGLAREMQHEPARIEIGPAAKPVDAVRQRVYTVDQRGKLDLLTRLLDARDTRSVLVFMRTKYRTDRIAKALKKTGIKAESIHGGRSQNQRQRAIDGFRRGRSRVLVATDVAARGIDVQGITHVINYDIPNGPEDYIHRIGRTARASATGNAITFVSPEDAQTLGQIERAIGAALPREDWEGAVHVRTWEAQPKHTPAKRKPHRPAARRGFQRRGPRPAAARTR